MEPLPGKLILARHHESEWNKAGLWTGVRDRHLTDYGFQKSADMGFLLRDIKIGKAFSSMKVRAIETLSSMLEAMGQYRVSTEHSEALNERDYGEYTGKSKWDMQKLVGEDTWNRIRREWDYPVPGGETLKMVYDRAVPYYLDKIVPEIRLGKNVLVVAHGNSCRAIMKYIEGISNEGIAHVEMPFGGILIYELNDKGRMVSKCQRMVESNVNA